MNVLKIITLIALFVSAASSFADTARVGTEQVKTSGEKANTAEMKQEKIAKKKKLVKARKGMKAEKREVKSSGTHSENSVAE